MGKFSSGKTSPTFWLFRTLFILRWCIIIYWLKWSNKSGKRWRVIKVMKWIHFHVCVERLCIHIRILDTDLWINAWVKNLTLCPIIVEEYINDRLKLLDTQVHNIPWNYSKNLVEWVLLENYIYLIVENWYIFLFDNDISTVQYCLWLT